VMAAVLFTLLDPKLYQLYLLTVWQCFENLASMRQNLNLMGDVLFWHLSSKKFSFLHFQVLFSRWGERRWLSGASLSYTVEAVGGCGEQLKYLEERLRPRRVLRVMRVAEAVSRMPHPTFLPKNSCLHQVNCFAPYIATFAKDTL